MKKSPGTSGLMPVKGSGCGIRPDIEKMENSEGFDFSAASKLLQKNDDEDLTEESGKESDTTTAVKKTPPTE